MVDSLLPQVRAGDADAADAASLPLAQMLLAALDAALEPGCGLINCLDGQCDRQDN